MSSIEVVRAHLANIGKVSQSEIYERDVVFEFPYAPRHHTQQLEGRDAVLRFLNRIGDFFSGYTIKNPIFIETPNPDVIVTEYACKATNNETQVFYEQKYIAIVTVNDGKIAHVREYYNPILTLVAFGEIEEPG